MTGERTLPGLGLTGFYDLGSDGWKGGVDENWLKISTVAHGSVKSRTQSLPTGPSLGDIYIVPSGDTPANNVAVWDGPGGSEDWTYYEPSAGWAFYVEDEAKNYQWTGAAWEEFAGAGGGSAVAVADPKGWTTLAVQEASADATIDFLFNANLYDEIRVKIYSAIPAADSVHLTVQVSDDSGSTWKATSYGWSQYHGIASAASPAFSGDSSAATDTTKLHLTSNLGNVSDESASGVMSLFDPSNSATHKNITFAGHVVNQSGVAIAQYAGGSWTGGVTKINGLRFLMASGNIASGKFVLEGKAKVTSIPDLNLLAQSPDWEIIDVQDVSAVANMDMPFDPNLFDEILLTGLGVIPAAANQAFAFRFSQDGGSTFLSGASDYHWVIDGTQSNNSTSPANYVQGNNASTLIQGASNVKEGAFQALFTNFGGGANARVYSITSHERTDGAEGVQQGVGRLELNTAAIDAIRVLATSGNITGKFILRGRRKITAAPITGGESVIIARESVTSGAAAVDFFFDPNLYEKVILEGYGVLPVSATPGNLKVRISTDGSTFSATDYHFVRSTMDANGGAALDTINSTATGTSFEIAAAPDEGANTEADFTFELFAPSASRHKRGRWHSSYADTGGQERLDTGSGSYEGSTSQINGLRIIYATGNIASGLFILRGIKKVQ